MSPMLGLLGRWPTRAPENVSTDVRRVLCLVGMRVDDDGMPQRNEVGGQLVDVRLDPAYVGVEKVGDAQNTQGLLLLPLLLPLARHCRLDMESLSVLLVLPHEGYRGDFF